MNEFEVKNFTYRIKRMNAIEVLAFQSQISFDKYEDVLKMYNEILEKIEVKLDNTWLNVKTKGKDIYYPSGIEDDVIAIQELVKHFLDYLKSVFQNSNASND